MQVTCLPEQAEAIVEYLQVIPGVDTIATPQPLNRQQTRIDLGIVIREEVQEGTLLTTAEERLRQYLWQRPDVQPVDVTAVSEERLSQDEEAQKPPEHIPPRRSL
jgi:hypothetical protein